MAAGPLLIGCAAGFSGDRVDAAVPVVRTLVERGGPAFLVYETLAERTLALAQLARKEAIYKKERFSDHAPITVDYELSLGA